MIHLLDYAKMTEGAQDAKVNPAVTTGAPTGPAAPPASGTGVADFDKQLEFLYKAHEDSQNLIRFLDAKAAFAIAILAAMTNKVLSTLGVYFPWGGQPHWRQLLILGFGLTAFLASLLVGLILFPITNPALNTRLIANNGPIFFLTHLSPKRWFRIFSRSPRFSRLAQDHSEYLNQITGANSAALLQVISSEVLKVAYIRQIKTDRLKAVTIVLASCAVFFVLLMGTDAMLPQPNKPNLVQIQGPVTMNPLPASAPPPAPPPGSTSNGPAPASRINGQASAGSVSTGAPSGSTKP